MLKYRIDRFVRGVRRRIWQRLYAKTYWHMRHFDGRFAMRAQDGETQILWRGRVVARSLPPAAIERRSEALAIAASGPSLPGTPAEAWSGRDIACVNGSILWARQHGIQPLLYVVSDPGFVRRRLDLVGEACRAGTIVCLSVRCLFEVLRQRPNMLLGCRLLVYENINQPFGRPLYDRGEIAGRDNALLHPERTYEGRHIGISTDVRLGLFAGGTVVMSAAQIGIALGYTELHFIGLDMKPGIDRRRFYHERQPEPSFIDRNLDGLIIPSFEVLKRFCERKGVQLFNWSPDSAIPRDLVPQAPGAQAWLISAE